MEKQMADILQHSNFYPIPTPENFPSVGECFAIKQDVGEGLFWFYGEDNLFNIKVQNFFFRQDQIFDPQALDWPAGQEPGRLPPKLPTLNSLRASPLSRCLPSTQALLNRLRVLANQLRVHAIASIAANKKSRSSAGIFLVFTEFSCDWF